MTLTELVERQRLVHQVTKLEQQRNELKWQVEYWQEQAVYWRRMGVAMCIGCNCEHLSKTPSTIIAPPNGFFAT